MGTTDEEFREGFDVYVWRSVFRELFLAGNVCGSVVGVEGIEAFEQWCEYARVVFVFVADEDADGVGV
jgi:hypothetical protein